MKKLVICDLDGTLYKAEYTFLPAVRTALEDMHAPVPPEEFILELLAFSPAEFVPRLLPKGSPEDRNMLASRIRTAEHRLIPETGRLYQGTAEVLADLSSGGCILAVCSNASLDYITAILESCGIGNYFPHLRGNSDGTGKPRLAAGLVETVGADAVVYAGDSASDQEAADTVGVPFIAAEYGYGVGGITRSDRRIGAITELPEAAEELLDRQR